MWQDLELVLAPAYMGAVLLSFSILSSYMGSTITICQWFFYEWNGHGYLSLNIVYKGYKTFFHATLLQTSAFIKHRTDKWSEIEDVKHKQDIMTFQSIRDVLSLQTLSIGHASGLKLLGLVPDSCYGKLCEFGVNAWKDSAGMKEIQKKGWLFLNAEAVLWLFFKFPYR